MTRIGRAAAWALLGLVLACAAGLGAASCGSWRREVEDPRATAPAAGHFVRAGDVEVFVQEAGPPEGVAVVLIHGTGAWSETWRPSMEALAAEGYRAIAIDLPPFGYSARPASGDYSKRAQGARIVAVLDGLGVERAILVGHSFGGGPTVEAALLASQRARGLVLVDAALGIREPEVPPAPLSPVVRAVLAVDPVRDGLVAGLLTNPAMTSRLIGTFVFNKEAVTEAAIGVYRRPLRVRGTSAAVGQWLPSLLQADLEAASELETSYAGLRVPVFAIWGERDSITPIEQGERLVELTPGATLVRLEDVGHIPQLEAHEAFQRALLEAVGRIRDR